MKFSTRLDGLGAWQAALSRIAAPSAVTTEIEAAADALRDAARANLDDGQPPASRSGALAAALAVAVAEDGTSATVSTPLDHGWHLEFGTLTRPPTPWLAPALDAARSGILARIKGLLRAR